jgi:glutamate dehydrogenase (NAD(P)+)
MATEPATTRRGELPPELDDPLFRQALGQFDGALPTAGIDPFVAEVLRYPERALSTSIPVRLDDGTLGVYPGYRVQHSSVLGPTKGGIRYDKAVTLGECAALAMWMTWKTALLRLPYGGAKGGVRCNPRNLSRGEL